MGNRHGPQLAFSGSNYVLDRPPAIGGVGYIARMFNHTERTFANFRPPYLALAMYALLGFDGLGHYALAPVSLHTGTMNATIWLECGTAALLLLVLVRRVRHLTIV